MVEWNDGSEVVGRERELEWNDGSEVVGRKRKRGRWLAEG